MGKFYSKIFIIFSILLCSIALFGQKPVCLSKEQPKVYLNFQFTETPQQQDSYFENPLHLPTEGYTNGPVPTKINQKRKMYVFTSAFKIKKDFQDNDLALFFGTSYFPCVIYLNKQRIGRVGSFKEIYTSQIHLCHEIYLPKDLLYRGDSANELRFQYYPQLGEHMTIDNMFVSTYPTVSQHTFFRNLIGINLVQASVCFGLVLFMFYIYGFILKKNKNDLKYLYFAFFCLSFFMSYMNMVLFHDTISQLNLLRISRFGLTVSNLLLIYLSMSFTGYFDQSIKLKSALAIPSILLVFLVIGQADVNQLDRVFTIFIRFVNIPYMLFAFGIAAAGAIRKKSRANLLFFIGFSVFFVMIVHDSICFVLQIIPYTWTIPHGYSFFILFIFFILATEQVHIYHLSVNRASQLQQMKDELEDRVKARTQEIEQQKEELAVQRDYLRDLNDNLSLYNHELQQKNEEITQQRDEIALQKTEIEQKSKNITDSIQYAQRIQQAIFPNKELLETAFPDHFVLFKPKHVVSGDFYFFKTLHEKIYLAVADCTGHGVPGAFMSMLGIAVLNEIIQINRINSAAEALELLRKQIKTSLHQTGRKGEQQDGMDISLCVIDTQNMKMEFAGANSHVYLYRKTESSEESGFAVIKGDRMPIGIHPSDYKTFTNHHLDLKSGDNVYLFSDGFISQFGGPRGDKFKTKRLQEMLKDVQGMDMSRQYLQIEETLNKWQGHHKQVDDILLVGVNVIANHDGSSNIKTSDDETQSK